ncbi:uncharacterized protein LOC128488184 [Spea bombifrons]|uniref:uncharacterized protein LOC128488184 n=1 Tax=Spea bombifrons TaxID=233779 RepID=UPI00234B74A6|nr:uncharacterized protein LOC128488184 [Spea bombifrons]
MLKQGNVMSMLVPGVLQNQLRHQMPGMSQTTNNGPFPPVWTPKLATQSVLLDSALENPHQNPQQPNQIQYYSLFLEQPPPGIPQQSGNPPTMEQTFGCLIPQFTGEVINLERIPSGALQLPTKTQEDTLTGKPTLEPNKLEDKSLLTGSDSEENIISGAILLPIDPGIQLNAFNVQHFGGRGFGHDATVGQQDLNPIGQHRLNNSNHGNISPIVNEVPLVMLQERGRSDSTPILKTSDKEMFSTYAPPVGLQLTLGGADPTIPPEIESAVTDHTVSSSTDNWIFCDSYTLETQQTHDMIRGDSYIPIQAPGYFVIEKVQNNQFEI